MDDQSQVLVVSVDPHAWNQPYVRSLLSCLTERFRVTVLTSSSDTPAAVLPPGLSVLQAEAMASPGLLRALLCRGFGAFLSTLAWVMPQLRIPGGAYDGTHIVNMALALRTMKPHTVLAVDLTALLACQLAGQSAHLVSLELWHNDVCLLLLKRKAVKSVLTQSRQRCDVLFPEGGVPCFAVPNFPSFEERPRATTPRRGLVLSGAVRPGFGLWPLLDLLEALPSESLTILGRGPAETWRLVRERYPALLESGRLVLEPAFLPDDEHVRRLSAHRIGFSFYVLDDPANFFDSGRGLLPWSHINFWTGFPGKIGMYMSAGVPVVASDLPGMKFVEDHDVGVLVKDTKPETLRRAIDAIELRHEELSLNCLALARLYSFREHIGPFVDFVGR